MRPPWTQPLAMAAATFFVVTILGIALGPSQFRGDEMEYFAMTYGFAANGSPTLTPAIQNAVQAAFPGRPAAMPVKAIDGSDDALHFWFLSALAAPSFALCQAVGLDWKHCFVFVNALALALAVAVTSFYFRWRGAALLLIGLLASPLFPYLNVAHAEAFSVSMLVVVAVFVAQDRLLEAALATSLIAAQVTAFAPLAAMLLLYWASHWWKAQRRPVPAEFAIAAACVCLMVLQPLWTLWRHHTLNLIVKQGFVRPELVNLRSVAGMLIDPDIGLLFGWPLGVVLVFLTIVGLWRNQELIWKHRLYWAFAIGAIAYLGIVGAQQVNYTTSMRRYSFWPIPFFLVSLILVHQREREKTTGSRTFASAIGVVCIAVCAASFYYTSTVTGFLPTLKRLPQAELWYRLLPSVYNPEEQVFADMTLSDQRPASDSYFLYLTGRYPLNELSDPHIWALSNKSCTKLLVFAYAFTSSNVEARLPTGCQEPLSPAQLLRYVKRVGKAATMHDRFVNIPRSEINRMRIPSFPSVPVAPPNRAPRVDSITTTRHNASDVTYVLRVSDPDGWQDIDSAFLTLADPAGGVACYLAYNQPRHVLAIPKTLEKDQPEVARTIVGQTDILKGDHCSLNPRTIGVTAAGDSLTLTIPITLDPALATPAAAVQTGVIDFARAGAGWTQASYLFAPPLSSPTGVTFSTGPDPNILKVSVHPGPEFRSLSNVWLLINDRLDPGHACYIGIAPKTRTLYLTPDDPDGRAVEMRLGQARLLDNGQCTLDGAKSTMVVSSDSLELTLCVVRKKPFLAPKRVWVGYLDENGKNQPWREVGAL